MLGREAGSCVSDAVQHLLLPPLKFKALQGTWQQHPLLMSQFVFMPGVVSQCLELGCIQDLGYASV